MSPTEQNCSEKTRHVLIIKRDRGRLVDVRTSTIIAAVNELFQFEKRLTVEDVTKRFCVCWYCAKSYS